MNASPVKLVAGGALRHPLLVKLAEAAARHTGVGLLAVFPGKDGGQQASLGGRVERPPICRMIQSTRDGARHCRICHVLMAAAASRGAGQEQRCHAGLSALVSPTVTLQGNELAVLSSCLFVAGDREQVWKHVRERGFQLKLDLKRLREAFDALPEISPARLALARELLEAIAATVQEIEARRLAESRLAAAHAPATPDRQLHAALHQALQGDRRGAAAASRRRAATAGRGAASPLLIRIIADLVASRPHLPYSVAAIAGAARITPGHFSMLFHRWTGQGFMHFLHAQRLAAAKVLLRNPALSIREVSFRVGYEDANYFARRFKQATRRTPLAWRNSLALAPPNTPAPVRRPAPADVSRPPPARPGSGAAPAPSARRP